MELLITFVVVVFVVGIVALGLRYALGPELFNASPTVTKIVWAVYFLIVLLILLGLFGYGPFRWR